MSLSDSLQKSKSKLIYKHEGTGQDKSTVVLKAVQQTKLQVYNDSRIFRVEYVALYDFFMVHATQDSSERENMRTI